MNTTQSNETVKTILTGMIVGGLAIATLSTTGCGQLTGTQIAELAAASTAHPVDPIAISSKLSANHNETFVVIA